MVIKNRQDQLSLSIADLIITVNAVNDKWKFMIEDPYRAFIRNGNPDIALKVHYGGIPDYELQYKVFDGGVDWSLYRSNGGFIFKSPHRLMIVDPDFVFGNIYLKRPSAIGFRRYPLQHPLDKILILGLLSRGRGMIVHGCGVNDCDQGLLFAGISRAGKSTMANLWNTEVKSPVFGSELKDKHRILLSDDRIIIRKIDGRFWMYGTPWHGDAKVYSPERVELNKVFFLEHASNNFVRDLNRKKAVLKLLVRSFPPFWDSEGMEFTLGFIDELTKMVPCYDLGFRPDKSIIDFIKTSEM